MSSHVINSDALLGRILHPLQLAIIEALSWIDEPLSPILLLRVLEQPKRKDKRQYALPSVAYHVSRLVDLDVLRKTSERPVRGAVEHFYVLSEGSCA